MNVLSLFDGISVARVALDIAGIQVKNYYSAEIDKYAIQVSSKNYPDIKRLGSVCDISSNTFEPIDLLIGGSPCQDLSIAKKGRKGLDGDRSSLFWQYVRIREVVKPKWFVLENVASMPQKDRDIITEAMGVEPVMFNASLVSAQTRKRLFWTNIKFDLPMDRGIILKDILQEDAEVDERMVNKDKKAYTLTSSYTKVSASEKQINHNIAKKQRTMVKVGTISRKLTPIECERLQSLPDNYTESISNTQRYICLGNAFNAEVIAHIFKSLYISE